LHHSTRYNKSNEEETFNEGKELLLINDCIV